jgi:hypothetical protein
LGHSAKQKEYRKKAIDRNKDYVRKLKEDNPCSDCGQYYHFSQMDFDHVSGKKKTSLARISNSAASIKTIKDEINKCELVCANCHRLRTWHRYNGVEYNYGKYDENES